MKIRFSAAAVTDLETHVEYYSTVSDETKLEFVERLDNALKLLSQHPEICPRIRGDIRRLIMHHFPIGIYYTIEAVDEMWIVSILHLKRDPDTINERLDSNERP